MSLFTWLKIILPGKGVIESKNTYYIKKTGSNLYQKPKNITLNKREKKQ